MQEALPSASPTELSVMDYLLKKPEEILHNSIHQLAEKTFSSPATILRMCRKLGFDGYREFRQSVIYELALRNESSEMEKKELTRHDSLEEIMEKVTYKNIISLENSKNLLDHHELAEAVDLIERARTVSLYGIGSSLLVARDMYLKFLRLDKPCVLNDDWHSQLLQARNCTDQDLGIIFSYSGQTEEMVACMQEMRAKGCAIMSITRYGVSPVTEHSDLKLYVAANESLFRNGAMSSRISMLNLVDILYTEYSNRNYDRAIELLQKTHIYKPKRTNI